MPAAASLAARAEALLNRLAQAQAQQEDQAARSKIESARSRASKSRQTLEDVQRVGPRFAEHGLGLPSVPEVTRTEVARARTALRSTATSIVGVQVSEMASRVHNQSVNRALEVADKLAKTLVTGLNKSVEKKRLDLLPDDLDQRIVTYPRGSHLLAVQLTRVQTQLKTKVEGLEIADLAKRLDDIVANVAWWAENRPRLETSIEGEHQEVKEFLRQAATEEGAAWDLVTAIVQEWLADPENAASIKIVLRS